MKSLPQKQLVGNKNAQNPYQEGKLPDCDLVPPNAASLRGFRTLLLQRKKLSEKIEQSGQDSDRKKLHNTQMYGALQKRFKSIFLWPAFLSIFMPRQAEKAEETPDKTPSKLLQLNLNKRINLRSRLIPQNLNKTTIDPKDLNRVMHSISSRWSIPGTSFLQHSNSSSEKIREVKASHMDIDNFSAPNLHKTRSCFGHKQSGTEERRKITQIKEKIPRPAYVKNHTQKKESNDNKIWSRHNKLSDEKLALLVNNYISERKIQENTTIAALAEKSSLPLNIVRIHTTNEQEQQGEATHKKMTYIAQKVNETSTAEVSSNVNVFMPRRVLEPPGKKRAMLENTVVALDTDDDGKSPFKKLKKN